MSPDTKGAYLMMGAMACFTINDTFMKSLLDEVPLYQALFLRGIVATLLLTAMAVRLGGFSLALGKRNWGLITLRTLSDIAATFLFVLALIHMPLANVTAILQALPLAISLAGAVFLRETIGWRRIAAIAIGFAGVLLIVKPGAAGFSIYSALMLICVGFVTVRDLSARRLDAHVPSLMVAVVGALGVTLAAGVASAFEPWVAMSSKSALQLVGAMAFLMGGYVFSVMTMRVGNIGAVTLFRYTGLLWAIALGVLVFGDWPDHLTLLGSTIVVATGIFTLLRERALGKSATPHGPRIR